MREIPYALDEIHFEPDHIQYLPATPSSFNVFRPHYAAENLELCLRQTLAGEYMIIVISSFTVSFFFQMFAENKTKNTNKQKPAFSVQNSPFRCEQEA